MKHIGILLFEGVEELDFVGPFEVFNMINEVMRALDRPDAVKVYLLSEPGTPITGAKGMRVFCDRALEEAPRLDVICVPGGEGTRKVINDVSIISWVRTAAEEAEWVASVCTGAFVLAKAGLTKGRNITTHWANFEEFQNLGLEGNLMRHRRYVRDGNVVTAAGVSAGIDMALWLTGQMFDPDLARKVQRAMEYDPAPPYMAEV